MQLDCSTDDQLPAQGLNSIMKLLDVLGYKRKRSAIRADWHARHKKIYLHNPHYKSPVPADVEKEHRKIWSRIGSPFSMDTLRVCHAVSGSANPEIVPEEIFAADLDRVLNRHEWHAFLSHKSLYNKLYPTLPFPESFLHCLDGRFFDRQMNPMAVIQVKKLIDELQYPVVFKPNTE